MEGRPKQHYRSAHDNVMQTDPVRLQPHASLCTLAWTRRRRYEGELNFARLDYH